MDGRRTEDLQRLYTLLSRIDAFEFLRQALSSYIRKSGQRIVMDDEKDKDMVQSLLDFKTSLDTIWEESFSKNESFGNTIKDSFEHLINLRQVLEFNILVYCLNLLLTNIHYHVKRSMHLYLYYNAVQSTVKWNYFDTEILRGLLCWLCINYVTLKVLFGH